MINDFSTLLIPLFLIAGGYYIKIAKDREPYAGPNMWKWLIIIGSILFVVKLILLILNYS